MAGGAVTPEYNVSASAAMEISRLGAVSWRNNVGSATAGKVVRRYTQNGKSYAVIENPRHIDFGLAQGSGDRVGLISQTVTDDMVGSVVARFCSFEFKTSTGRASKEQVAWHDFVHRMGGYSGFIRCDDDVGRVLRGEKVDP